MVETEKKYVWATDESYGYTLGEPDGKKFTLGKKFPKN